MLLMWLSIQSLGCSPILYLSSMVAVRYFLSVHHIVITGVSVVISPTSTGTLLLTVSEELLQVAVVDVVSGQHHLKIVALYRSPAQSLTQFRQRIDRVIRPHLSPTIPTLVVGDFNVDARLTTMLGGLAQLVIHTSMALFWIMYIGPEIRNRYRQMSLPVTGPITT